MSALTTDRRDRAEGAVASGRPGRSRRIVVRLLALTLALVLLVPVAAAGYVVAVGSRSDLTTTDAIVVLGAAQFDGEPSPVLEARLARALALAEAGVAPRLVTVGGKRPGDRFTEAGAGRDWLLAHGADPDRVTAVETGSDTAESLAAVARLAARRGWTSVTLVTDPAHEARSRAIAADAGLVVRTAPTETGAGSSLAPEAVLRETAGLLHWWALGRWQQPERPA